MSLPANSDAERDLFACRKISKQKSETKQRVGAFEGPQIKALLQSNSFNTTMNDQKKGCSL